MEKRLGESVNHGSAGSFANEVHFLLPLLALQEAQCIQRPESSQWPDYHFFCGIGLYCGRAPVKLMLWATATGKIVP